LYSLYFSVYKKNIITVTYFLFKVLYTGRCQFEKTYYYLVFYVINKIHADISASSIFFILFYRIYNIN